jgi:hypothetical protein
MNQAVQIAERCGGDTAPFVPEGSDVVWATPDEMARLRVHAPMDRAEHAANLRRLRAAGKSSAELADFENI